MIKPWMVHRFFKILNAFLAGICLIVLGATARLLLTQDSIETVHSQTLEIPSTEENVQKSEKMNYSFPGNFISEDSQIVEDVNTGIELKGMLSYPEHHYAIVQFKGEQKLVKSGDRIGAWKIREINEENLTIERNGKIVILRQSRQMSGNIAKSSSAAQEMSSTTSANEYQKMDSNPKEAAIPYEELSKQEISSENKITVDEQVFRKLMTNWADLFRGVQMMPYVEKGKSKGYVLCYLQPDGLMQKLGFRTGDIIEKINDREITNLQTLMALYDFAEKGDCRIEIKRGPKRIQMVYQFSKNPV